MEQRELVELFLKESNCVKVSTSSAVWGIIGERNETIHMLRRRSEEKGSFLICRRSKNPKK